MQWGNKMNKKIVTVILAWMSSLLTVPAMAEDGGLRFLEKVQSQHIERQEKAELLAVEEKAQAEQEAEALQARDQQAQEIEAKPQ